MHHDSFGRLFIQTCDREYDSRRIGVDANEKRLPTSLAEVAGIVAGLVRSRMRLAVRNRPVFAADRRAGKEGGTESTTAYATVSVGDRPKRAAQFVPNRSAKTAMGLIASWLPRYPRRVRPRRSA